MSLPVIVVTSYDQDDPNELVALVIADGQVSDLYRMGCIEREGNPYLIYGDIVTDFTGRDKYDTSITRADCRSGDLEAFKPLWHGRANDID